MTAGTIIALLFYALALIFVGAIFGAMLEQHARSQMDIEAERIPVEADYDRALRAEANMLRDMDRLTVLDGGKDD